MNEMISSYSRVFRVIFVLFSLYLLGDAFYRWDGFRYYASFYEFLPNVALVLFLWSAIAALVSAAIWLPFIILKFLHNWLCTYTNQKKKIYKSFVFTTFLLYSGPLVWFIKRMLFDYSMTIQQKIMVLLSIIVVSMFFAWQSERLINRIKQWIDFIQYHITPLVWLFGIFIILSVPLIAVSIELEDTVNKQPKQILHTPGMENIFLITFDALTARNMSVYGYDRPTTPFISEWAKSASVFTKAEAEGNNTATTIPSLMTGKRIWTHQIYHERGRKIQSENMPSLLFKNGYYNMAFVVNHRASVKKIGVSTSFNYAPSYTKFVTPSTLVAWDYGLIRLVLYRFFHSKLRLYDWIVSGHFIFGNILFKFMDPIHQNPFPVEKAFNNFLEVVDSNVQKPFFVWFHLMPPHEPYMPPKPYMRMFSHSPKFMRPKPQSAGPHTAEDWDILKARYDEFIRYCDEEFKNFLEELEKRNLLENAIVILSADHGESFEHNYLRHSDKHLYEQVTNIPLILKQPGQNKGQVIEHYVEQIDIPATILDLAGIPVPSWMEGRSLVPMMNNEKVESRPIFSMTLEINPSRGREITRGTIAVWEENYKLIHYLGKNTSLLFNLEKDPGELFNLYDKKPSIAQHLIDLIKYNLNQANERIITGN